MYMSQLSIHNSMSPEKNVKATHNKMKEIYDSRTLYRKIEKKGYYDDYLVISQYSPKEAKNVIIGNVKKINVKFYEEDEIQFNVFFHPLVKTKPNKILTNEAEILEFFKRKFKDVFDILESEVAKKYTYTLDRVKLSVCEIEGILRIKDANKFYKLYTTGEGFGLKSCYGFGLFRINLLRRGL